MTKNSLSPASSACLFTSRRSWRAFPVNGRLDPQVAGSQLPIDEGHRPVRPGPSPQAVLEGNQVENVFSAEVDSACHVEKDACALGKAGPVIHLELMQRYRKANSLEVP